MELSPRRIRDGNRNRGALYFRGPARHVPDKVNGQRDVGDPSQGHRFAVIQRLQLRKFFRALLYEIRQFPQEFSPF